ncbi:hypothetical protein AVEN_259131-1 [Araneus ventricosus]|uniref:Uncharacterized protein n=1 Tax=Araneus ventricosus TaxID=182803 RepID=A0A4Y2RHN6_ARAVE|nr:hypothetical protein AVEN_259131-1 [Araneus ventricosus]
MLQNSSISLWNVNKTKSNTKHSVFKKKRRRNCGSSSVERLSDIREASSSEIREGRLFSPISKPQGLQPIVADYFPCHSSRLQEDHKELEHK